MSYQLPLLLAPSERTSVKTLVHTPMLVNVSQGSTSLVPLSDLDCATIVGCSCPALKPPTAMLHGTQPLSSAVSPAALYSVVFDTEHHA